MTVECLSPSWQARLADLLASSNQSLLIAAPYIKQDAAQWLLDTLNGRERGRSIRTTIMTDVSPQSVLSGSLDIEALLLFTESLQRVTIFDIQRLHAKVYIADDKQAIITSGNLTSSAFGTNYEYGMAVTDSELVKKVSNDMRDYAKAGRQLRRAELSRLSAASRDFAGQYQRTADRMGAEVRRGLTREWDKIAASFGAPPGLHETGSARFKGPIVEVLTSRGPLATPELCDAIQTSWPYLCDDTLIRVARDGTRKRQWRHDIHTAQETLQTAGVLRRDKVGLWHMTADGRAERA